MQKFVGCRDAAARRMEVYRRRPVLQARDQSWHATCLYQLALSAAGAKALAGVEQGWPRAR